MEKNYATAVRERKAQKSHKLVRSLKIAKFKAQYALILENSGRDQKGPTRLRARGAGHFKSRSPPADWRDDASISQRAPSWPN